MSEWTCKWRPMVIAPKNCFIEIGIDKGDGREISVIAQWQHEETELETCYACGHQDEQIVRNAGWFDKEGNPVKLPENVSYHPLDKTLGWRPLDA